MAAISGLGGGMLSHMKYVNVEHTLPQIGIRQEQAKVLEAGYTPAEMHREYQPPLADMGIEQAKVDIDTYPCRKAYGFLNNEDFARKYGQEGFQDLAAATSKHTQRGWDMAKNGARPTGNTIVAQAKSDLWSEIVQWPQWVAEKIPDPEFTVTPARIKGQMDVGYDRYSIQPATGANIDIQTGSAETYIATEGSIRMWTTEGHYDTRV